MLRSASLTRCGRGIEGGVPPGTDIDRCQSEHGEGVVEAQSVPIHLGPTGSTSGGGGGPLAACPRPERDLEAPCDHERAAKEFLDAADRIYSQAKVGAIPFDINVITAAQVNATIDAAKPSWPCFRNSAQDQKKGRKA
jgi:hypothetical protein